MDYSQIVKGAFDLSSYRLGIPQQSGVMTVLPLLASQSSFEGRFVGPQTGLKLSRVNGYGNMEIANPSETGLAIVPLHMGYIQDRAQNHALCRSAFLAPGQKLMFEDACCVQAAQGGYLEGKEQWFFILPLQLRLAALGLRGQKDYSKLWNDISHLNQEFGLSNRGHLEEIISKKRAVLNQYQSRFELLPGQTGALFFINTKLVGLEIAPTAAYFQELWMPLVCFCYGVAALSLEEINEGKTPSVPFLAHNLRELREQLAISRRQKQESVAHCLAATPVDNFDIKEEERFLKLRLYTMMGKNFAGQFVKEEDQLVYASVFAKPEYFSART